MVKEVDYVVLPSLIFPEKVIYAGVITKEKEGGTAFIPLINNVGILPKIL